MKLDEATFQAALERALCAPERATRVQRINSGDAIVQNRDGSRRRFRGASEGTGDLVGFVDPDGRHLEVEAKAHDGRVSAAQRRRGAALTRAGAVHVVVWAPEDLADLEAGVERAVHEVDEAIERARARRRRA